MTIDKAMASILKMRKKVKIKRVKTDVKTIKKKKPKPVKREKYEKSPRNIEPDEDYRRECLACGRPFATTSKFVRMCHRHRKGDVYSDW